MGVTRGRRPADRLPEPPGLAARVVASCTHAVLAVDPDDRLVLLNPAAERLYGRAADEALGTPATQLVHPAHREAHAALLTAVLSGEGACGPLETEHLTGDGERLEVQVTASAVAGDDGRPAAVSLFVQDIGARRAVERQLADARARADRQGAELARSNADLERFAYVASHDLSEPLRAISGLLDLLRAEHGDALQGDAGHYVDRSILAAGRLRLLIDALLDFARLGRTSLDVDEVDCQALAEDVADELRAGRPGAPLSLRIEGLPTLRADRAQLRRVLENLLANAVKFCEADEPSVSVTAREDPGAWTFEVRDNGIGVAPAHASRIFDVFRRLHARDAYDGTGIGLAVCERVVALHGGRIAVAPADGGGSCFTFTIPHHLEPAA